MHAFKKIMLMTCLATLTFHTNIFAAEQPAETSFIDRILHPTPGTIADIASIFILAPIANFQIYSNQQALKKASTLSDNKIYQETFHQHLAQHDHNVFLRYGSTFLANLPYILVTYLLIKRDIIDQETTDVDWYINNSASIWPIISICLEHFRSNNIKAAETAGRLAADLPASIQQS